MFFVVSAHKNQSQFKTTALLLQMNVFKSAFFHCLTQTIFIVVIVWRFIQTPSHLTMESLFQVEKSSNVLACPLDSIQDSNFKFGIKTWMQLSMTLKNGSYCKVASNSPCWLFQIVDDLVWPFGENWLSILQIHIKTYKEYWF